MSVARPREACGFGRVDLQLQVLERRMGVKFIWGEVKSFDVKEKTATHQD